MSSIKNTITTILSEYSNASFDETLLNEPFVSMGIDSLSLVEIIFDVEEHFDIKIPSESDLQAQGHEWTCINDLIELVTLLVREQHGTK